MGVNYRAIAEQAMTVAIDLRDKWKRGDDTPLDIYALAFDMGVSLVR